MFLYGLHRTYKVLEEEQLHDYDSLQKGKKNLVASILNRDLSLNLHKSRRYQSLSSVFQKFERENCC